MSADPTRPLPEWSQAQQWSQRPAEPPTFVTRRRRRKGPWIALITVIVLLEIGRASCRERVLMSV